MEEQKKLKDDLERCKLSAEGLEHTSWTEVCESEVSKVKKVHKEVMSKSSQFFEKDLGMNSSNGTVSIEEKKKVNLDKNMAKDQIKKMDAIVALLNK